MTGPLLGLLTMVLLVVGVCWFVSKTEPPDDPEP